MESRDDALLSERLAALPLESPPAAGWSELRARLRRSQPPRASRRASPGWLALAAGLVAVLVLPQLQRAPLPPPARPTPQAVASAPQLAALMRRSQALEAQIRALRANGVELAEAQYEWERAIEGDLALIDVGLAADGQTEALWRERVRLLEELRTASQTDTGPLLLQARLD
ncbi:MAG: hypothetical protein IT479_11725 [Xanthomonadales bacterium]|nr:hypothetical protein [Xanthomonadales bacterium]MCC6593930.1 hypothetical protein [Xanthomonadales bacterium]